MDKEQGGQGLGMPSTSLQCQEYMATHREDLENTSVQIEVLVNFTPDGKANCQDSVRLQVLEEYDETFTARVINQPEFSSHHGYTLGGVYEIAKTTIYSYTRTLKKGLHNSTTSRNFDVIPDFLFATS